MKKRLVRFTFNIPIDVYIKISEEVRKNAINLTLNECIFQIIKESLEYDCEIRFKKSNYRVSKA